MLGTGGKASEASASTRPWPIDVGAPSRTGVNGNDLVVENGSVTRLDLRTIARAPSTTRVLLVGAGGHARMCVEILNGSEDVLVVGAVSGDGGGVPGLGTTVLGLDAELEIFTSAESASAVCVAIGDNFTRWSIAQRALALGCELSTVISRHAIISATAELGAGVQIMPAAVVNAAAVVGEGAIVNSNATVEHDCRLGAFAHVATGTAMGGGVTIGDRTLVGVGSRILPGVTIGSDVVVGAGAVVAADVPDGVTVCGIPARAVCTADRDR